MKFYLNQTILFADLETIRKYPFYIMIHVKNLVQTIWCDKFSKLKLVFDNPFLNPTLNITNDHDYL